MRCERTSERATCGMGRRHSDTQNGLSCHVVYVMQELNPPKVNPLIVKSSQQNFAAERVLCQLKIKYEWILRKNIARKDT
jgi:hypothetical protein